MYLKGSGLEENGSVNNASLDQNKAHGTSSDNNYKYDAFISYRHGGVDAFVAKELHKLLEGYKLPAGVKSPTGKKKITRIFKDTEELPLASNLSDPITEALSQSRYLIVICSPRLNESEWCKTEVSTFIKMHGRENVFCVVAEGEPVDVFPLALTMDESGSPLEPLAADFRGADNKEIKKRMKQEYIRLIAPMFKLGYDDIKRRERENRIKSIIRSCVMISAAAVLLGCYFAYTSFQLSSKNKQISEQADAIMEQSLEISSQAEEIADQNNTLKIQRAEAMSEASLNYLAEDNIKDALQYAYDAAVFNEDALPFTAGTQYALSSALRLYEDGWNYVAVDQVMMQGKVSCIKTSSDGRYAILGDIAGYMVIYDCANRHVVYSDYGIVSYDSGRATDTIDDFAGFISDTVVYYIDDEYNLVIYDISSGSEIARNSYDHVDSVVISKTKNYLAVWDYDSILIYSTNDFSAPQTSVEIGAFRVGDMLISEDDNYLFMVEDDYSGDNSAKRLHVFDMSNGEELQNQYFENCDTLPAMAVHDGYLYLALGVAGGDSLLKVSTDIVKYDAENAEVVWTFRSDNMFCNDLTFSDKDELLAVGGYSCRIIDVETGKGSEPIAFLEQVVGSFKCSSSGYFVGIEENGGLITVDPKDENCISVVYVQCVPLMDAAIGSGCILGAPKDSNRIILYSNVFNSDAEPYDGEVVCNNSYSIKSEEEIEAFASEYDLPNPRFISNYDIYDDIAFVTYGDNTVKIFDLKTMKLLSEVKTENGYYATLYGEDTYGNHYIGSGYGAYCLNENYELIGYIKSFAGLSEDKNRVIISYDGTIDIDNRLYSIPIYTYDELVEMAGNALREH